MLLIYKTYFNYWLLFNVNDVDDVKVYRDYKLLKSYRSCYENKKWDS